MNSQANASFRSSGCVDLNCDLGESYGVYRLEPEQEMLSLITSANIACGFHAGDPAVMARTVGQCLRAGVAVGAHPGLPDRAGFGRRWMQVAPQEVYEMVLYQIGALSAFVKAEGGRLRHVKPHGALYNAAAAARDLADAIVEAVRRAGEELIVVGLAGSELVRAAEAAGLAAAHEAFADRKYAGDGALLPRDRPGAVLERAEEAEAQTLSLVLEGRAAAADGSILSIRADTICIHGDSSQALQIARRIRSSLERNQVQIRPLSGGKE